MHAVAQVVWHAPRLLPLAIVIAALSVLAVLIFYIPQARRLRQPWRSGLPLLRLCVGLALAASVVQPVLVRSESSDEPGAVIVLVDASRSMAVVDPRPPAQRVALADALGLLPPGARTLVAPGVADELDALREQLDEMTAARADVDYAKLSGQGVIAAQTRYDRIAADVASRAARLGGRGTAMPQPSDLGTKLAALAPPPGDDYPARVAAARAALVTAQSAADAALYARADVKPVCDELATLSRAQLADRATSRARDGVLASIAADGLYGYAFAETLRPLPGTTAAATKPATEADGLGSDIVGATRGAAERMRGRLVQAIVVLTDGRQVGGDSGVASGLSAAGVPVYPVSVGMAAPRDVAILNVALPSRQFVGETTTARVTLRGTGMKDKAVEVRVDAAGHRQAKTVTFAQPNAAVEFPLKFDAAAVYDVSVTVSPQDGEVTAANNAVTRRVVATADRAAVALVGASASWDFQYLRAALARASWASVDAEVLDAPGARWSLSTSDILQRSAVILSDVAADHLTPRQWDALYQLVADRGGSVMFLAGRNTTAPGFIDSPLLADLLPFRAGSRPAWRTWPGEHPLFRFQPAPGATDATFLRLGNDPVSSERWLELPALFQYLPVTELKANTTPLLVERESGLAVMTDSRLGLGRVLFFGANETWRWRRADASAPSPPSGAGSGGSAGSATGGGDHERFWLQLVRYAVDEPYAVRTGPLRLDADRVTLSPGQSVRVRAKVLHGDEPPGGEPTLPLTVTRGGGNVAEVLLERDADAAGRYSGTLDNLAAGTYELRWRDPAGGSAVATLPLYVEPDAESEMRDVSGDERLLRRLAESTGGAFLTLAEWNTLPRRLREAHQTNRPFAERRLWDSPLLFAFVLGCLGIEWAMRKRLGLA